jgi:hypothetical protein
MRRWLTFIIFILSVLKVAAQNSAPESPKELLFPIQKSKSDNKRISLQLLLGDYYLFKPGEFKIDHEAEPESLGLWLMKELREYRCRYQLLS